ncbi:MAG: hypothetical protein WBB36_15355, partial [Chitinophagales bacterium]
TGRISKSTKPDLEALTTIQHDSETFLLALGSGSIRGIRDKAFLYSINKKQVTGISLRRLYDHLRNIFINEQFGTLNIEGALFYQQKLFLFQRGNISGRNLVISIAWNDFLHFEEQGNHESILIQELKLPMLHGLQAGISGACIVPGNNMALFTASLENTSNAIDDGPSAGSYIGLLGIAEKKCVLIDLVLLNDENRPFLGKVESIAVTRFNGTDKIDALAVCDEDGNPSQLLKLEIRI